jgi:hypothetical protein
VTKPIKKEFSGFICRPYCAFFKEGQKDEMACGAALMAVSLIENGLLAIASFPALKQVDNAPRGDRLLFELICRSCPFVLDGCDFRLPTPPADAVACGGFVLLCALYRAGTVTSEMLRTIAHE